MANILVVLLGVGVVAAVGGGVAFVLLKKKKKDEPKEKGEEGVVEQPKQPKERSLIQPKDEVKAEPVAVAEDKVKPSDKPTTPPPESKEEEPKKEPEPEREPTPEFDEPFPTPDDQSDELLETVQGEVPDELREAVSWLNSLNTSDVDNCQRLMTEDTFKFLLKGVKGIRNEDGQVEENLPYHSLSILAQIFTRGLSRNQRSVAETAAAEFRSAHGLNVVYDISTNSSHLPSKQLAAILTAFTFAYEPIPSEYKAVVQILTDIVLEYDKNASASLSPGEPQSREAERLVALALHALTLLLQNEDNLHLILEDYIGRDADETFDRSQGGSPPPTAGRRGFSSTSPQPRPQAGGSYSADSPQGDRGGKDSGEVPDLPLSALQSKIVELVSHEDKNIAAWAIRFFSVQALHMTINEKRAFVEETDFFDVVKDFVSEPTLDDETLPVVENTVLAMHSISLNGYDKAKSIILKSNIAKELFKTLVRIDFKALGNPDVTHISPLNDNGSNTPDSLLEPLTVLSPQNSIFTAEEQSLHVDRQVHLMGIVEHTLAIYKSLHHNIQCLEYLVKMGIATPISNILYNYHRKLRETQILHDAAEESYGRFLANTLELLRYLAALGVDEVIGGRPNGLRTSLENIGGIKVQANLLTNIPWDDFTYDLELKELNYTNRGLLDLAFAYTALFAGDNAPEDARVAFDFMNKFRASDSPLVSKETPSLYVKYYNYVYNHVENIEEFKDPEEFKEDNDNENNDNENNDNENNDNENNDADADAEPEAEPDADAEPEPEPDADANDEPEPEPEAEPED